MATQDNSPKLTETQILELQLHEQELQEHLRSGERKPFTLTLELEDSPGNTRKADEHVRKLAAVVRYCADEAITPEHFHGGRGALLEFPLCYNAASILAQRAEFLEEPDTTGFAVLFAAGFGPTSESPAA